MPIRIGVDEAGKGDYFGYLVVAAVAVDEQSEEKLTALRVRESKQVLDADIRKKAMLIKRVCPVTTITISPERYNQLHAKFGNLNKLLAWAHAKAIENMLKDVKADSVITDQFGDESYVKDALAQKNITIRLIQRPHADENDIAVAAASVMARAIFLDTLRQLSLLVGYKLPKGATHVDDAAKVMVERHGSDILDKIAKVHFRTTKRVLGGRAEGTEETEKSRKHGHAAQ